MRIVSSLVFVVLLSGCALVEKGSDDEVWKTQRGEPVDIDGLKTTLGMDRPVENLGYEERKFNSCEVGHGYPSNQNCRDQYLAVVNLRLQCRDSDGTVSTVQHQLTPIQSERVVWNLGKSRGYMRTDAQGYGQVQMISPNSPRKSRLRVTIGKKFLAMTAEDMNRVVTPREWCRDL